MCAQTTNSRPGVIGSVIGNRCPRCRRGRLFTNSNPYNLKKTVDMPDHCEVCGQKFELHTGFYFGTGYVSYALTVAFTAVTCMAWWLTAGFSLEDNSVLWWLGVNTVLMLLIQPLIQRLARSIWIAFFVRYDAQAGGASR